MDAGGTFTVQVSDEHSCVSPVSESVTITEYALPVQPEIDSSASLSFCDGGSVVLSAPTASSYLWSNGETTKDITVDAGGTFTVQVSDEHSCISPVSESVTVIEYALPVQPEIDSSGSLSFCDGGSVILSAPVSAGYLWSNGETTKDITVSASGTFSVQVSDDHSCQSPSSDLLSVNVNPVPAKPVISYTGNLTFCEGGNIVLSSSPGFEYEWSNGEITQSITVTNSGTYQVLVKNSSACSSEMSDAVEVIVHPIPLKPVISPSGPINLIVGDSIYLDAGIADNYLWSTSESTNGIYVKTSGFYTVQVFSDQLCYSEISDPVEVTVTNFLPKPAISLNGSTGFCEGNSLELTSETADKYFWSTGETTQTITVNQTGSYTLIIENAEGVQSLPSDAVIVNVYPNPELSFSYDNVSCFGGDDGTLTAIPSNGLAPYSYNWSNGGSTEVLSDLSAGSYQLTLVDANSCVASGIQEITQPTEMLISETITEAKCPESTDGELVLSVSGATPPYSFEWNTGGFSNSIDQLNPGTYTVIITDNNFCEVEKEFDLGYINELCFMIPDIITPNNDGRNDTWVLEGLQLYSGVEVEIYDRWGKRVFYSRGYDNEFDGTNNGKELPMESYHYIINLNNGTKPIIGNITIVR